MNYFPVMSRKMAVFNHTVNVMCSHILIHPKIKPQKATTKSLKYSKSKGNTFWWSFWWRSKYCPLYLYYGVCVTFVISWQIAVTSSTLYLRGDETLMKALADRFVYLFEVPGTQPGSHTCWANTLLLNCILLPTGGLCSITPTFSSSDLIKLIYKLF